MKEIIEQYDKLKPNYQKLNDKTLGLIKSLLKDNPAIRIHDISNRVKERDSLIKKIEEKGKYQSLDEITDISGIRIICYFEQDLDKVSEIIESEFEIDPQNSIDKRKLKENEFGYKSLHLVVSFKQKRTNLAEYKDCIELKTEIQIRTILQHGWAEIEHDLGYKSSISVPENYKRDFNRVAALLETADKEFSHLRNKIENYENEIPERFKGDLSEIGIDKFSLQYFLENDQTLREVEKAMANVWSVPYEEGNREPIEKVLYVVNYLGNKTIGDLVNMLNSKKNELIEKEIESKAKTRIQSLSGMSTGVSLFRMWIDKFETERK